MFKAIGILIKYLPTIVRLIQTLVEAWDKAQAKSYIKKVDETVQKVKKADTDEKRKALAGRASALAYELRKPTKPETKPRRRKKKIVRRVGR